MRELFNRSKQPAVSLSNGSTAWLSSSRWMKEAISRQTRAEENQVSAGCRLVTVVRRMSLISRSGAMESISRISVGTSQRLLKKPQEHRRYGGIWLLVYAPARRIVIGQGEPVMTGSGNQHSSDFSVFSAQRGNKALRLVVMYYRVLVAVYD